MLSRHFVDNWTAGDNSFAENPPNAVLSYAEPADRLPEDAVVVFIDPFGRPLSPVSAAGMHRRERRRR
jgi:hypothetical protein